VLCHLLGVDREPAIVFTSDIPGLVAAQGIVGPEHERVVYLSEDEFAAAPARASDPQYRWHVHVWSFFRSEVEPAFAAQARAQYPIASGCCYWQHSEGTMWAVRAGRGVDHLWRWDGDKPELLEEAMSHWVVYRPGRTLLRFSKSRQHPLHGRGERRSTWRLFSGVTAVVGQAPPRRPGFPSLAGAAAGMLAPPEQGR
jgi:hypothetical protein